MQEKISNDRLFILFIYIHKFTIQMTNVPGAKIFHFSANALIYT